MPRVAVMTSSPAALVVQKGGTEREQLLGELKAQLRLHPHRDQLPGGFAGPARPAREREYGEDLPLPPDPLRACPRPETLRR